MRMIRASGRIHSQETSIWDEIKEEDFRLPKDKPLTLASYMAAPLPEGYIEPAGVGDILPEMPIFLTTNKYVNAPLDATYQNAWEAVPAYWRNKIAANG